MFVTLLLFGGIFSGGKLGEAFRVSLIDAYLQVTVFVAFTLLLVQFLEKLFSFDLRQANRDNPNAQIVISAILGATPGCGGAIIVVTQFASGHVSFGALMAVLTSTMGDAAFLIIAAMPFVYLKIMAISLVVGILSGYLVNYIFGKDYLRPERKALDSSNVDANAPNFLKKIISNIWFILLYPGMILGFMVALQVDVDGFVMEKFAIAEHFTFMNLSFTEFIGLFSGALTIFYWMQRLHFGRSFFSNPVDVELNCNASSDNDLEASFYGDCKGKEKGKEQDALLIKGDLFAKLRSFKDSFCPKIVIEDASFVTVWVFLAFLSFEVASRVFGLDLALFFNDVGIFAPLIATLVGFIPGCGPQIVISTLYLAGAIPFSAQIANAISNDGDALFPAFIMAPKASVVITLLSSLPALIIGYTFYMMGE